MFFKQIIDPKLSHYAYLIGCQQTGQAVLVDPQRDVDRYLEIAGQLNLRIVAAAETHIHADYVSGLREMAEVPGVIIYASDEGDTDWKYEWLIGSNYHYRLLKDKDSFQIGTVKVTAWHTPGHTPEHLVFEVIDTARHADSPMGLLTGDFVFVGDVGRPDLLERAAHFTGTMERSARSLYESLQRFKNLSPALMIWPGHGAGSACGKTLGAAPVSTIGYELISNPSLGAASEEGQFVDYILRDQPEPPAYFARMKAWNKQGPPLLDQLPRPKPVSASELSAALSAGTYVVVDTREWNSYSRGHIQGALHTPFVKDFPTLVGSYVEPGERVFLVVDEERIEEAVRDCIRVGVDTIERYITPAEILLFARNGGNLVPAREISIDSLPERMADPEVVLLDVRRTAELVESGMIGECCNIAHTQLLLRHQELPRDKDIHVFCRTFNRSRWAYGYLERAGYRVTAVGGGTNRWVELGRPMTQENLVG